MRQALRVKNPRAGVTQAKTVPAPVGGWNARDSLAAMSDTDAVELVNMFPGTSTVEVRGGSIGPQTTSNRDATLMVYAALDGTSKLFGGTLREILGYGVDTVAASVVGDGSAALTLPPGILAGRQIWTMFGDGTNQYLIIVNGMSNPVYYWGQTTGNQNQFNYITETTSPLLSGVALDTINYVNVYKGRLFFLVNASLKFYYLAAGAAGGALSAFDLSGEAKKGGRLVAMSSWTRDAGDGQDDVAVFITSEGEAILYQGNNPASANSWSKVGTFYVGRPLGNRCMLQYGPDLLILTESGVFELSTLLQDATISTKKALSYKIETAFTEAARRYGRNFGWRLIHYPAKNALLVNVPIREGVESEQFVMNTITKQWCRFTGWHALDFAVFQGQLYFIMQYAGTGTVLRAWVGGHDWSNYEWSQAHFGANLKPIDYRGRQAYTPLGRGARQKRVTMIRPLVQVGGHRTVQVGIDVDFQARPPDGTVAYRSAQAVWGEAIWGQSVWPTEPEIAKDWTSVPHDPGLALSISLRGSSTDQPHATFATAMTEVPTAPGIEWIATDLVFEEGSPL